MQWYPRACPVCAGDLHDDLQDKGWLTCFFCARSFDAQFVLAATRGRPAVAPDQSSPALPRVVAAAPHHDRAAR